MNNIKNIKALYRSPRTSIVGSSEATLTSRVRGLSSLMQIVLRQIDFSQTQKSKFTHSFSQFLFFRKFEMTGVALPILLILSNSFFVSCKKAHVEPPKNYRPVITEEGVRIKFDPESPGLTQIKVSKFGEGEGFISIAAPSRVIASISTSVSGGRIVLFESPDINGIYASYQVSKTSLIRSTKNLNRVQDMFKNQVATQKDIIEAEAAVNSAQAETSEFEGKLRALGFNPSELQFVNSNLVWLICDIPETNMSVVKKGKDVKVHFASFPELTLKGKADAIGDNVDPLTRTVKVRVSIPNKEGKFKPGMFAKVEFGDEVKDIAVIPFTSVITVEGHAYVFVQTTPGEFVRRPVVLGNSGSDNVSIVQGLIPGEEVVTGGAMLLKGLSFGY
ncbi:MAG: efflux RND transporter periplasmic adaptor subunit [Leptospiraceae bacterium]|jgi:cobalt-zinc-cadmium efflux system membrane fusion protein|nr:efflux RND transporter periplasmic adaptor subunit [Leptospiraceae bacterium]MBK7055122.1 efflux RND transporter periplasmic adaptor subunit [Leptospiraceae bacterium]MBK9498958.1 efflux RND transporter periplasmic adaptor subunit [Leptospiraceae bacterium]MBP9163215.1 efflux RND transporter periplasmic adaptor subunit [Leptospiraceae bacterium]